MWWLARGSRFATNCIHCIAWIFLLSLANTRVSHLAPCTDVTRYFSSMFIFFALLITLTCGFSFNQPHLIAKSVFMMNLCSVLLFSFDVGFLCASSHSASFQCAHSNYSIACRCNRNVCLCIFSSKPNSFWRRFVAGTLATSCKMKKTDFTTNKISLLLLFTFLWLICMRIIYCIHRLFIYFFFLHVFYFPF